MTPLAPTVPLVHLHRLYEQFEAAMAAYDEDDIYTRMMGIAAYSEIMGALSAYRSIQAIRFQTYNEWWNKIYNLWVSRSENRPVEVSA